MGQASTAVGVILLAAIPVIPNKVRDQLPWLMLVVARLVCFTSFGTTGRAYRNSKEMRQTNRGRNDAGR